MALAAAAAHAQGPKPLKLPPLARFTTSTGLRVISVRREPIPMVAIRLVIRAGAAFDPPGKYGLAQFTAQLLRRGTAHRTADELNEAVEFVGGTLALGADEDVVGLNITAPAEHLVPMLDVLGELVREPAFPPKEVDAARERTLAQLAHDLDDPGLIADRALMRALFGDHPYGHDVSGNARHVYSFTRDDVVQFHRELLGPRVATLIVVGRVDPAQVAAAAEKAFAGWNGGPAAAPKLQVAQRPAEAGTVWIVDKPDQTQSQIRIGTLAFPRGHPDFFPAIAVNTALGGSFTSRLVRQIRVNRGLSYSVGSSFDTLAAAGSFSVSTFTRTETTEQTIEVALDEVAKVRRSGLPSKELKVAQRFLSGLYPARLETNEAVSRVISEMELYNLGDDWVERFRERLQAVAPKQAAEVAAMYLFPDAPAMVVVGNAAQVEPQVKRFGRVKVSKAAELE